LDAITIRTHAVDLAERVAIGGHQRPSAQFAPLALCDVLAHAPQRHAAP
jgi:hypothetical protein